MRPQRFGVNPQASLEKTKLKEKRDEKRKEMTPSPTQYRTAEAFEKTCGQRSQNLAFKFHQISKTKKTSVTEKAILKAKQLPGVGQYQQHIALDKVARPMRKGRL